MNILIVIENMSYTYDTRVQKIARTLIMDGNSVYVICPRYPGDPIHVKDNGAHIHYYWNPKAPDSLIGHLLEYTYNLAAIAVLALKYLITKRIDLIHVCNPPDLMFPLGLMYRLVGRKYIYDQHDLCPELFEVRYGKNHIFMRSILILTERLSILCASHVIFTNTTSASIVKKRVKSATHKSSIIPNTPQLEVFDIERKPDNAILDNKIKVGYIGNMNPQDGIDYLLRAAHYLSNQLNRKDIRFICIGNGGAYEEIRKLAFDLDLENTVTFTGRLKPSDAMAILAGCDLCIQPDPKNNFTDSCAMVKSFEYMALSKPIVAFDLTETMVICNNAAIYAHNNDFIDLANKIVLLADNQELRNELGVRGRSRIEAKLNWSNAEQDLLNLYSQITKQSVSI